MRKPFSLLLIFLLTVSLVLPLLSIIPIVYASPSRVQGNCRNTATSGTSLTVTMTNTPTSGNILVAVMGDFSSQKVVNFAETGVTWDKTYSAYDPVNGTQIWKGVVGVGASKTVTITFTGSLTDIAICDICEYTGVLNSTDKTASTSGSGTTADTGTTASTSQADELFIGGTIAYIGSTTTVTQTQLTYTMMDGANELYSGLYSRSLAMLENIASSITTAHGNTTIAHSTTWAGCILTLLGSGYEYDYVDNNSSNVDSSANVGTSSNFTAEQYGPDSIYDTLSEAAVGGAAESYVYGGASYTTAWTTPNNSWDNVTATEAHHTWGAGWDTSYLTINLTTTAFGNKIQYWVQRSNAKINSMQIDIANQTGSWANVYTNAPSGWGAYYNASFSIGTSQYTAMRYRFYKSSTTAYIAYVYETQAVNNTNYRLDIEEQWTAANYTLPNRDLCIYMGTFTNTETLLVQWWNATSSSWTTIISSLIASSWNNISVTTYLSSATFTIRFLDGTQVSDGSLSTWQKDCAVLHTYTSGATSAYNYIDEISNVDSTADIGTHNTFANEQAGPDGTYDNMTCGGVKVAETTRYGQAASGTGWTNPSYSIDNDTATPASQAVSASNTTWLVINYSQTVFGTALSYWVARSTTDITTMYVEIANETGAWTNVYAATPTYNSATATYINFTVSRFTATRFCFYNFPPVSSTAYLNETRAINNYGYGLSLEEQWTGLQHNGNAGIELCVYMGSFFSALDQDNFTLQYWKTASSSWITLDTYLAADSGTWSNVSVAGLVTGSNFTIRFYRASMGLTQGWWQKDCVLLHTFTSFTPILPSTMVAGLSARFMTWVKAGYNLTSYYFETNNTGTATNTTVTFSNVTTPQIANITLTVNSTVGNVIQARCYVYDVQGSWFTSDLYSFTVEDGGIIGNVAETDVGLARPVGSTDGYWFSAIGTMNNGTVLSHYTDSTTSEVAHKIYGRTSNDEGITWGNQFTVDASTTYIAMSMLTLPNGTTLEFGINGTGSAGTGTCYDYYRSTNDNGTTWGSWVLMGTPHAWMPTLSQPVLADNGTIIFGASFYDHTYTPSYPDLGPVYVWNATVWRSDDNGTTWYLGGQIPYNLTRVVTGLDEPSPVIQMNNGSIYMIFRTFGNATSDRRHWGALSNDMGLTWNDPQPIPQLFAIDTQCYVKRVASNPNAVAIIWINRTTYNGIGGDTRRPCLFAMSYDDCVTFTNVVTLDAWTQTTPYNAHDFSFTLTAVSDINFILGYRRYMDYYTTGNPPENDAVIKTITLLLVPPRYYAITTSTNVAGASCIFTVNWTVVSILANITLAYWNSNNTGSWLTSNETAYDDATGAHTVLVNWTTTLNETGHNTVQWQEWCQDTNGVWNTTGLQNLTLVTNFPVDLEQTVTSTLTLLPKTSFNLLIAQSISSSLSMLTQTNYNVFSTLQVSSSLIYATATQFFVSMILGVASTLAMGFQSIFNLLFANPITSSLSFLTQNAYNLLTSNPLTSSLTMLSQTNFNVLLSSTITSTLDLTVNLFAGATHYIVDLTLTVASSLSTQFQTAFAILFTNPVTSTINQLSQTNFNLELSSAITSLLNLNVVLSGINYIVDLTLTVTSQIVSNLQTVFNVNLLLPLTSTIAFPTLAVTPSTVNLALVLAVFAVAMSIIAFSFATTRRTKKEEESESEPNF